MIKKRRDRFDAYVGSRLKYFQGLLPASLSWGQGVQDNLLHGSPAPCGLCFLWSWNQDSKSGIHWNTQVSQTRGGTPMTFCLHYGSRSFETSGLCVYLTIDFLTDVTKIKPSPGTRKLFSFPFRFFKCLSVFICLPTHTYQQHTVDGFKSHNRIKALIICPINYTLLGKQ